MIFNNQKNKHTLKGLATMHRYIDQHQVDDTGDEGQLLEQVQEDQEVEDQTMEDDKPQHQQHQNRNSKK
ncbi:hypothetical protein KKG31_03440 [Patescibacteria group bacterium]|nr:hypothetical protein [Patescibacteria group bacterium]MBU1758201.1 hypothetical protein [Patescibacteria group bacterium]